MSRWRILTAAALLAAGAMLAAACGGGGSSALAGTTWRLERIGAQGALPEATPWLKFDSGGDFAGHTGCNSLGGTWKRDGDRLTLSDIVSTLIGCDRNLAEQESSFTSALRETASYRIDGDTLTLRDGLGAERMVFVRSGEAGTPLP